MENDVTLINALEDCKKEDTSHIKNKDGSRQVLELQHEDGLWMSMNQFTA